MRTVKEIFNYINTFAPFDSQLEWDNSGLLVGDPEAQVETVAVCLDATCDTVKMAAESGAQLLVTHHPIIFGGLTEVVAGSAVHTALVNGLSVICVHTPWDCSALGVNTVLAKALGVDNAEFLENSECVNMPLVGDLEKPLSESEFCALVKSVTGVGCVKFNSTGNTVTKVALCGGAGADFCESAVKAGADALVTADIKHHQFLGASELGITLIDAGHYNTENLATPVLARLIATNFDDIQVTVLDTADPVSYI